MNTIPHGVVAGNPSEVVLDINQALAFVSVITGDPNSIVDIRAVHETDRSIAGRKRRGTIRQYWGEICAFNNEGFGIFITINEMDGQGVDNTNVTGIRAQFVDLDGIDAQQMLNEAAVMQPAPAFYVQSSPGKFHIYWRVWTHADVAKFTLVQRKLITKFNGDPTIIDPARIMRLPGTLHMKNPAAPTLVQCCALPAFDAVTTSDALDMALWDIVPSELGSGNFQRIPVGQGDRAPSTDQAIEYLQRLDVRQYTDRNDWLGVVGAFMQSVDSTNQDDWNRAFTAYMVWNEGYPNNDPAANVKVWNDFTEHGTTVKGWNRLHREATGLTPQQARLLSGQAAYHPGTPTAPVSLSAASQEVPAIDGEILPPSDAQDGLQAILKEATIANAPGALVEVVKALAGRISVGFDTFSQQTRLLAPPPWAKTDNFPRDWTDADTVNCQLFVQTLFNDKGVLRPGKDTVFDAVSLLASHNKFNPLQNYLNSLKWDGVGRIRDLLPKYFGAIETPYHQTIGAKFMVSAVARGMQPGCKVDAVLILEGKQGIKKSSSIAALVGEGWFTDELPDLSTKDAAIQLVGKWIVEVSELSAFKRSDTETIKKFMSRSTDRFRAPYGKVASDHPRQTVFIATTNDDHYLKDTTGNRRFWPVQCGQIDIDAIRRDRDQLWAEAVAAYRDGLQWWLTDEEAAIAETEQDARREVDPWEERVASFAKVMGNHPITMDVICTQLGIAFERRNAATNSRIAKCLRLCGYERKRMPADLDGKRPRAYVKTTVN